MRKRKRAGKGWKMEEGRNGERKEDSNKAILALLVIALVVTAAGVMVNVFRMGGWSYITGADTTETGTAAVTVQGTASVSITDGTITFPTGYYNASCTTNYARINSNATTELSCWLNTTGIEPWNDSNMAADYHTIVNNGTTVINLSLDTDKPGARGYLCGSGNCPSTSGTNAVVTVTAYNSETGTCGSGLITANTTILDATSETPNDLCTYMNFEDTKDELNVSYMYVIPSDADQGAKTMTVTYTATAQ